MCRPAAESDPPDGKRKCEPQWPIFKINHQRSRYLYELYYNKEISRELYEFCLDQGHADRNLIAKWKKLFICSLEEMPMCAMLVFASTN
jgi:bud site selection protein 31